MFNGVFWKFSERICAQLVSFAVSIILARLLTPSDYGAIVIVMIFITIADVFVTSGFGIALVQKKNIDDIDFSSAFYFNIVFSIVIYAIMFYISPLVASVYDMAVLSPALRIISIKLILAGINSIQQAYVARNMLFFRFFWSTLIGTVISAVVGIVVAYLGYGVWALIIQYLTNSLTDTVILWLTVKWRPKKVFELNRLIPLVKYAWKILADQLFSNIYISLKSIVIGKIYTSDNLAYYSKGTQFPDLLVININASIISVIFPALSKLQDDKVALRKGLKKVIRISSFLLSPVLVGLFVVAPTLISIAITDKWIECIPYLRIACIYYLFFPVTTANLEALLAIGESGLSLKLTIIKRVFGILLIILTIKQGVWVIAVSEIIVVLLALYLNTKYIGMYLKYSIVEQLKDVLPSYFSSLIMGIIVYGMGKIFCNVNLVICLIIQILTGISLYISISFLTNKEDLRYIRDKISINLRKNK